VGVDDAVLDVLETACDAARRSQGAFDPTVLPLMRLYGFYQTGRSRYPSDREIAAALDVVGWQGVAIDRSAGTLGLERRGAAIDLGSIGKGWALDRAVEALRAEGIRSGMVDVGGNVYGLGVPEDGAQGWSVASVHPETGRVDRIFVLRDCAVATSGNYERSQNLGAARVGHLLDARRGHPSSDHLSVNVQAKTGVFADVLSTTAFLLGPDRFRGWPEALDTHFIG
jgi:thiamine biosynthesis lipoprotein